MANLRAPVRNVPSKGDRHQCKFEAEIDGQTVDLTNEQVVRGLNLENGTIFTCEAIVIVAGKETICGKEYSLHYPTKFQWKLRRKPAEDGTTATEPVATEPAPAQAEAPKGRGKH